MQDFMIVAVEVDGMGSIEFPGGMAEDDTARNSSGTSLAVPRGYSRSAVTETGTPLVSDSNTGECPGPS
jgi:hypothetical protein